MSKVKETIGSEIINLSVGYLAGLTASYLVSSFFVRKGLVNLWGIAAKRQALNKDQYEWLMAITAYVIGLAVMLLVSYGMKRWRSGGE